MYRYVDSSLFSCPTPAELAPLWLNVELVAVAEPQVESPKIPTTPVSNHAWEVSQISQSSYRPEKYNSIFS
jgi:hypothetical protein